jgi:hypothetical protein
MQYGLSAINCRPWDLAYPEYQLSESVGTLPSKRRNKINQNAKKSRTNFSKAFFVLSYYIKK